jgi:AP-4 complex subunit beta-1
MKNMNSSQSTPSSNPGVVSNAPKFFVDHKKGEVVELMNLLKNPNIDKDQAKKKDVIKRVIAYMTLGVDVSKLFYEMVKVIQ